MTKHSPITMPLPSDSADNGNDNKRGQIVPFPTIEAPAPIERPITAQQLSEILPLHPGTILRWAREGKIPCTRLSVRKILFLPSQIYAWLASGSKCLYPAQVGHAANPYEMRMAA